MADLSGSKNQPSGKRRGPRPPAHLLKGPGDSQDQKILHRTSLETLPEDDKSASLSSSHDGTAASVQDEQLAWRSDRVTHSPFMRSAIVQGTAPLSRVRNTAVDPSMPVIQSVLGLAGPHCVQQSSAKSAGRLVPNLPHQQSAHGVPNATARLAHVSSPHRASAARVTAHKAACTVNAPLSSSSQPGALLGRSRSHHACVAAHYAHKISRVSTQAGLCCLHCICTQQCADVGHTTTFIPRPDSGHVCRADSPSNDTIAVLAAALCESGAHFAICRELVQYRAGVTSMVCLHCDQSALYIDDIMSKPVTLIISWSVLCSDSCVCRCADLSSGK